jgi:hypothetical protein
VVPLGLLLTRRALSRSPVLFATLPCGPIVFGIRAAVRGCDFSAFACGIRGTGKKWLLAIFDGVCDTEELTIDNAVP